MAKLTKVINGEQVTIEGTIEELKQFQEKGNITSDLLSPKERLDTDNKDEELKLGDIVKFTEDSSIELEASGIHSLFLPNKEMKKGQYAFINQKVNGNKEPIVDIEGQPYEIELSKVKDIIEKVGEVGEENPLKLQKGQDYLIHNYDGESYDEVMTLENIDGVSYLFTSEDERLFVPYRKKDELLFSDINEDDDIEPVVEVEDDDDLKVGKYYNVSFIHCDYSNDTLSGKVKLKEIDEDGDYIFVDEENTVSCIIKPENLDHYIFDELEENEESKDNEEETEKPENNQKEFKEGNIVEVIEEVGGVKKGNYGIVMGYDFDGDVILAGYDRVGVFSDKRYHLERGLKLIKE